jgi:hypothetical protein
MESEGSDQVQSLRRLCAQKIEGKVNAIKSYFNDVLLATTNGLHLAFVQGNNIQLSLLTIYAGENISCVAQESHGFMAFGLIDLNRVEIVNKKGIVLASFEIERPSDIHVVHSKLIVRNDKGIWLADPSTKLVWKIMDAGGN